MNTKNKAKKPDTQKRYALIMEYFNGLKNLKSANGINIYRTEYIVDLTADLFGVSVRTVKNIIYK